MDTLILKLIMDISFYLAVFMPVMAAVSQTVRAAFAAVIVLWAVWLFVNWKKRNLVDMVQYHFFMEMRILVFFEVFEGLFLGLEAWKRQCVPFLIAFVISGILLMRAGRLSAGKQGRERFWGVNGGEVLAVSGAAFLLSWEPVSHGFVKMLGAVYNILIFPVLSFLLNLVVRILMWLAPFIGKLLPEFSYEPPENQTVLGNAAGNLLFEEVETREAPAVFKLLGMGLLLLLLLLFFRYLYRRLSEQGGRAGEAPAGEVRRSAVGTISRKGPGRKKYAGEKNVRYYYRCFLELCAMWGIQVEKGAVTSEEVEKDALKLWGMEPELKELRNLYLHVRYGEKKESGEEKRRAKELYKAVKEKADKLLV